MTTQRASALFGYKVRECDDCPGKREVRNITQDGSAMIFQDPKLVVDIHGEAQTKIRSSAEDKSYEEIESLYEKNKRTK